MRILGLLIGVGVFAMLFILTPLSQKLTQINHRMGLNLWQTNIALAQDITSLRVRITQSKIRLVQEKEDLQNKLEVVQGMLLDMQRIQKENESLREQLNVVNNPNEIITAQVLSTPTRSIYRGITVQAGEQHGVAVGQYVTAFGTVLLGRVVEVYPRTAHVALFTDPDVVHTVFLPEQELVVESTGRGSGNLRFDIPRDIVVAEGDYILSQETGKILGMIHTSLTDPREPVQTVLARSPLNLEHLQWVQVITTP